jgi:hypothetical protein
LELISYNQLLLFIPKEELKLGNINRNNKYILRNWEIFYGFYEEKMKNSQMEKFQFRIFWKSTGFEKD